LLPLGLVVRDHRVMERGTEKTLAVLLVPFAAAVLAATPAESQESPPAWAYPVNPPDLKLPPDEGTIRRVPGSNAGYTLTNA
jgi:hypothetical protein